MTMRTQARRAATFGSTARAVRIRSKDSDIAAAVKSLVLAGDREAARDKFSELVATQQRRAVRIAYHYLRDAYDADEAVQDAFVKVFTHITMYREDLPFEVWFTRILVNACLDIGKARARRLRWVLPMGGAQGEQVLPDPVAVQPGPEARLMSSERASQIAAAIEQLPDRQRAVFTMCHIAEQSTSEVSAALGVSEATVRVHLFRAIRRLRTLLASPPSTRNHQRPARGGVA
jgi:RNA polymerase sigma-70 factor (ECF subfamily)